MHKRTASLEEMHTQHPSSRPVLLGTCATHLHDGLSEARDIARLNEAVRLLRQARRRRGPFVTVLSTVLTCIGT